MYRVIIGFYPDMGASCSKVCQTVDQSPIDKFNSSGGKYILNLQNYPQGQQNNSHDQQMHRLMRRSLEMYTRPTAVEYDDLDRESGLSSILHRNRGRKTTDETSEFRPGQYHLLYRQQQKNNSGVGTLQRSSYSATSITDKENAGERKLQTLKDNRGSCDTTNRAPNKLKLVQENQNMYPTRLVLHRNSMPSHEEGVGGAHVYAVRWPAGKPLAAGQEGSDEDDSNESRHQGAQQEQHPRCRNDRTSSSSTWLTNPHTHKQRIPLATQADPQCLATNVNKATPPPILSLAVDVDDPASTTASVDHLFQPSAMCAPPKRKGTYKYCNRPFIIPKVHTLLTMALSFHNYFIVRDWVTISSEHNVYVADVGLSPAECDRIVAVTEQACRGQYAAYTYAKQTLGCREFPELAELVHDAVHTITHAVLIFSAVNSVGNDSNGCCKHSALALDDREPHMVKYDVTKKERQKLDMHTDKSEWTFLMALSNGCGLDYSGGGTYFECLDSTVHIQRGHALIFPGKLRHRGQRITAGLRFLLVGFLVDKSPTQAVVNTTTPTSNNNCNVTICKVLSKDDTKVLDSSGSVVGM